MMTFRQRMGWLCVFLYLLLSLLLVFYVFELRSFSLELVERSEGRRSEGRRSEARGEARSEARSEGRPSAGPEPPEPPEPASWSRSVRDRLPPLPAWLWASIFVLPYLQVFLFLYSCTRPDPRTVGYCILPVCLAVLCNRHSFSKASNQIGRLQLIDT
ncbi:lysosomal enzyme trafficking factor isoform X1 [Centroberyx affinis]|uniref:lysosomal enzyme trafficking factor isoform X1 n=1 Tax=Centroberyx affinis TaxID=166261 RepID=UPI003A5C2D0B